MANDQLDTDQDGVGDACDNCPLVPNSDQANEDNDAAGNACNPDDDGDGCLDNVDDAPLDSEHAVGFFISATCTPSSGDVTDFAGGNSDGDSMLDCEDDDDDNDGVTDETDPCPVDFGTRCA